MRAPSWVAPYIGIPYVADARPASLAEARQIGAMCWSLFALVQRERFGADLSEYEGPLYRSRRDAVAIGQAASAFAARFDSVEKGAEREGDAILLRVNGHPIHVGLVIASGLFLHIEEQCASIFEDYHSLKWRDRVLAFHRVTA